MAAVWPGFMPQLAMRAGNTVTMGENFVRGPADVGLGSRRRRSSSRIDQVSFPVPPVSKEIFDRFLVFYRDELADGAKSFEYYDHRLVKDFICYIESMSYELVGDHYRINLELSRKSA